MGFSYERPTTVERASALLAGAPGRSAILAGGTDLQVHLRAGTRRPDIVVDVKHIPELTAITLRPDGSLAIGAAVAVRRLYEDPLVAERFPALAEGARAIGTLQLRARATVGGNLCNASPCMDTAPPLLVLGARLVVASPEGLREVPIPEFFVSVKRTALRPGELLTTIVLPPTPSTVRSAFEKIKRLRGHDLALVNAAGAWDRATGLLRAAIGSCGVTPVEIPPLTELPTAGATAETVAERLAAAAVERIRPIDDVRASAEYRRDMTALLCRRLVMRLMA